MLFNSIHFLIFFPIVVALYFFIKHKYRWILLLLASYYFYMSWKPEYVILIIVSTLVDYGAALLMDKTQNEKSRKLFLLLSLITNLGLLFAFKYFNFVSSAVADFFNLFSIQFSSPASNVLLPVGISFYTFQTLSYTIDVYKRKIKPEKHLGIFAVYVSFFPQLVAGPIERAKNLLPQFFERHKFSYYGTVSGLRLILWGLFKKIVIADGLALFVDKIYGNVGSYSGVSLILATLFFAFQIYCDFSGYSDIAIGSARVMGFRLMDNFRAPYLAKTITDFWRRWHISLYSWLKDYIYFPLGGKRVRASRWYFNIFFVFLISGLWHGANWTFIVWGVLHGFYLIFSKVTSNFRRRISIYVGLHRRSLLRNVWKTSVTFILVCFSWIFFRASNLADAVYIIKNLFTNSQYGFWHDFRGFFLHSEYEFVVMLVPLVAVVAAHFVEKRHHDLIDFFGTRSRVMRWSVYYFLLMAILLFGTFGSREFIYFNF